MAENGEVGVTRAIGEGVRELLAHALHQPCLATQSLRRGARLERVQRIGALRLHAFEDLGHVGETDIGAVERKQRRGREGDACQMRAMGLRQRDGKRDARLGRFGPVHIDDNVVEPHHLPACHDP